MSKPLLSILIPTVVGREDDLLRLLDNIKKQKKYSFTEVKLVGYYEGSECHYLKSNDDELWIEVWKDDKQISIGQKREMMYEKAQGLYSQMTDDDDLLADDAIERILGVIKTAANSPDCITFQEAVDIDGVKYCSNFSLDYGDWEGDGSKLLSDGFHFHRTPFFKTVIKTEIAKSVPIPHTRFGEDHQWAQALKPHLKTEIHIPRNIYFYNHISSNPTERYGLDK